MFGSCRGSSSAGRHVGCACSGAPAACLSGETRVDQPKTVGGSTSLKTLTRLILRREGRRLDSTKKPATGQGSPSHPKQLLCRFTAESTRRPAPLMLAALVLGACEVNSQRRPARSRRWWALRPTLGRRSSLRRLARRRAGRPPQGTSVGRLHGTLFESSTAPAAVR